MSLALVFGLDQITKAIVRHSLLVGESFPRDGVVRITHTFNTGSAFGLFPDQTLFLIVASFAGISILLLVYRNHPLHGSLLRLSLGMQLGGALGNLVDRIRMGQVTDFIDLGFWPVFNLADASIVIGIIILVSLFPWVDRRRRQLPETGYAGPHGDGCSVQDAAYPRGHPLSDDALVGVAEPPPDNPCPVCESPMEEAVEGPHCSGCGAEEGMQEGSRNDQ